jgi:hypothetical protein
MRRIAQIETVAAVATAIRHRKRPGRDRQGLLRGVTCRRLPLAGQDLSDVILQRQGVDPQAPVRLRPPESNLLRRLGRRLKK